MIMMLETPQGDRQRRRHRRGPRRRRAPDRHQRPHAGDGHLGQVRRPARRRRLRKVIAACHAARQARGHGRDLRPPEHGGYIKLGARFVLGGSRRVVPDVRGPGAHGVPPEGPALAGATPSPAAASRARPHRRRSRRGEPRGASPDPSGRNRDPRHSCTEIAVAETSTPEAWVQGGPRGSPLPDAPALSVRCQRSGSPVRSSRRRRYIPECERGPGGWGGGTPWTHASGDAVSLADVFSARASADYGSPAPGSRECPRPPGLSADTDECAGLPGSPPPAARSLGRAGRARHTGAAGQLTRRARIPTLPA